jgi:general L-amino acid transport system permease protein
MTQLTGSATPLRNKTRRDQRHGHWGFWYDELIRSLIIQALVFGTVVLVFGFFAKNAIDNMNRVGITSGFDFLSRSANFAIGESMFEYQSSDSYGHAVLVGLANTIKVSLLGCVFATLIGTVLGVMRLSTNPLLRGLVQSYVETIRNIPLLLQLFFWYAIILNLFPGPRVALNPLPGTFLSNRGIVVPALTWSNGWLWFAGFALVAGGLFAVYLVNRRHRERTGQQRRSWPINLTLLLGVPAALLLSGQWIGLELPALAGFNFKGGATLSPEFAALLTGLTLYSAALISEIVRSGIQSVSAGQREAAYSVGLSWSQTMRLVILPQALRVVVPPITSIYLALTKNSSLAVAIGYPDLVSVVNTTMNQTGQAVENIAILMSAYLTLSIGISLFMNWYNAHVAIREN